MGVSASATPSVGATPSSHCMAGAGSSLSRRLRHVGARRRKLACDGVSTPHFLSVISTRANDARWWPAPGATRAARCRIGRSCPRTWFVLCHGAVSASGSACAPRSPSAAGLTSGVYGAKTDNCTVLLVRLAGHFIKLQNRPMSHMRVLLRSTRGGGCWPLGGRTSYACRVALKHTSVTAASFYAHPLLSVALALLRHRARIADGRRPPAVVPGDIRWRCIGFPHRLASPTGP